MNFELRHNCADCAYICKRASYKSNQLLLADDLISNEEGFLKSLSREDVLALLD